MLLHPLRRRPSSATKVQEFPQLIVAESQDDLSAVVKHCHYFLNDRIFRGTTRHDHSQASDANTEVCRRLIDRIRVEFFVFLFRTSR